MVEAYLGVMITSADIYLVEAYLGPTLVSKVKGIGEINRTTVDIRGS